MTIHQIVRAKTTPNWILHVVFSDGVEGDFDVSPYLKDEAFEELRDIGEFMKIRNGGYFIEWGCGADLSADTLRAKLLRHSQPE